MGARKQRVKTTHLTSTKVIYDISMSVKTTYLTSTKVIYDISMSVKTTYLKSTKVIYDIIFMSVSYFVSFILLFRFSIRNTTYVYIISST